MNFLVSADKNWAIGKNGRPLVTIPAERQLLLKETAGKTVVMGRRTLETLPGGQPLGGRTNLVLSEDPSFKIRGAEVCRNMQEALDRLRDIPSGGYLCDRWRQYFQTVSALLRYHSPDSYRLCV